MVLPASGTLSVQNIETEFQIGTAVTKKLSNDLGPLIANTAGTVVAISTFYGKAYAQAVTSITQGATTSTSIVLNWSGGAGATSFSITSSPPTTTETASGSGYTFPGLSASTGYVFTIVSKNAQGVAGGSAVSGTFTTSGGSAVPGNPEWLALTNMGQYGGTYGNRCIADTSNFVYLLGACTSTTFSAWDDYANQSDSTYTATTLGSVGLVKYHPNCYVTWLTNIDGAGNDLAGAGIDLTTNYIYISGRAGTTFPKAYNAGSSTTGVTCTTGGAGGSTGFFIAKYDYNGVAQWMVGAGNSGGGGTNASGVCVDPSDNVYGGWRRGNGSGGITYQYYAGGAGFIQTINAASLGTSLAGAVGKWNSAGTPLWAAAITCNVTAGQVNSLCWDNTNSKLYCSGPCGGVQVIRAFNAATSNGASIGGSSANVSSVQVSTANSNFVAAYNTSGTALWISVITNANPAFQGGAFVATSGGSLYVLGSTVSGAAPTAYNAGSTTGTTASKVPTAVGSYLVKYNTSGVVQWITIIDSAGDNWAGGITSYNSNVYVSVLVPGGNTLVAYNAGSSTTGHTAKASTYVGTSATVLVKYYSNGVPHTSTMMENNGNTTTASLTQSAACISPGDGSVFMPAIQADFGSDWIGWGTDQATQVVAPFGGQQNALAKFTAF